MKVKMLISIAGHADPANGVDQDFAFHPGQEVELPKPLAEKWIDSGHAEPAGAPVTGGKKSR